MPIIRTTLGTDFAVSTGLVARLVSTIDTANPGYRRKLHLIRSWLIEFDEAGNPWREIGLDADGSVVVAGPSTENYGFWLDTSMRYSDFTGESVSQEQFEVLWAESEVTCA